MAHAILAFALLTGAAEDPNGTWKWSTERNGTKVETVLKLKLEGDKLTGTISGRDGKEAPIEEAAWKDGEVSFCVSRERDGQKFTVKYAGKVAGDTITGKSGGGDRQRDWKAERVK